MPFKSEKQRKWMWANDPEMAEKWEDEESNEDKKREGRIMRITKTQLRKIIRESISDNVSLEIMQDRRGPMSVEVPYYIITDALEDGLGIDGLFIEIEEFIDNQYSPADAWTFPPNAHKEITRLHKQYQEGGVWSDDKDYEAGFYR
jgi:hypothetical protein